LSTKPNIDKIGNMEVSTRKEAIGIALKKIESLFCLTVNGLTTK
jgi:hypothetical protein